MEKKKPTKFRALWFPRNKPTNKSIELLGMMRIGRLNMAARGSWYRPSPETGCVFPSFLRYVYQTSSKMVPLAGPRNCRFPCCKTIFAAGLTGKTAGWAEWTNESRTVMFFPPLFSINQSMFTDVYGPSPCFLRKCTSLYLYLFIVHTGPLGPY